MFRIRAITVTFRCVLLVIHVQPEPEPEPEPELNAKLLRASDYVCVVDVFTPLCQLH